MAVIKAPPDQNGVVLDAGDVLLVELKVSPRTPSSTRAGAWRFPAAVFQIIRSSTCSTVRDVEPFGVSNNSVINKGGRENVDRGVSNGTNIVGGVEVVDFKGHANDTTISGSGRLDILGNSDATNVTFAGQGRDSVEIQIPANLKGTISGWHVGDFVDLIDIRDVSVSRAGQRPDREVPAGK